jgi:lipopolysaccharide transport system ATP-binding protein
VTDCMIRVEKLSKKYLISHRQHDRHPTIKDVLGGSIRSLGNALRKPFSKLPDLGVEELWALKDISFQVHRGDRIGIIGRNGAGKTTLLKILSRITQPTEGRVAIRGRVSSLLEVGTGFHPELTGRENIYLNGAIHGMSKAEIEQKFDEIVAFSEVEKFLDTPVKRYSSGMYVRLAFAVAAHLEPEILIVDEVLAVGDAQFQKKCLGKMGEATEEGRTILFVSHNMRSIANLTQRCIWLEGGRVAADGDTEWVINQYMERLNASIPGEGWADLSGRERLPILTGRKARLQWVRILSSKGDQVGTFLEGQPITVEIGFRIMERVGDLQFGCSVKSMEGNVELFTVPSPEFVQVLEPGEYSVKVDLTPNHLRKGDYLLALKLFADGRRQDTISQVIRLTIQPYLSPDDNPAYLHDWVAGHIRFDYEWGAIESKAVPQVEASPS